MSVTLSLAIENDPCFPGKQHYCDHMIVSVRESKARLSELLAKAIEGEEIVITVRGEPTAKIVPVQAPADRSDLRAWVADRRSSLAKQHLPQSDSSSAILDELRADRF